MSAITLRLALCALLAATTIALVVPVTRQDAAPLVTAVPIPKRPGEMMMPSVEPEVSAEPSPEPSAIPMESEEPEMTDASSPAPEPISMSGDEAKPDEEEESDDEDKPEDDDLPGAASIVPSSGGLMMDNCFLQKVDFGTGTAERCCELRFPCDSYSGSCGKFACSKVYIKFSYIEDVDAACENQLVKHKF